MKIISSELYVKDNKVYHEGNKPKPKDIGAAPETHTHNYASATTPGGSAEHAIKATEDSLGQRIDTYIKGLSVSGRTITYTRGDGTTGTIVTQDNNTDTKVTNTLNTTAKAYITGTTDSATNTGTQVFDTNVYLDTTAGMLTATTFKGALQGNATTATSATSATSATKLATARTINGTNFDGTGNITTANWGTARNIQIGDTTKSVNGSTNVSWSIGEIGAAPIAHNHTSLTGITNLSFATEGSDSASITTTVDGANTYFDFTLSDDPSQNDMWRWRFRPSGANVFNAMTLDAISTTEAKLAVTGEVQATRLKGTLTGDVKGNVTGTVSGNAGSATKLATARTINGTNFDGSTNITTANWGTARNIQIGNAVKSVNGSANVTWNWSEMQVPRAYSSSYSFGGNQNAITTAQFITMLTDLGAFSQVYWVSRGSWSYASNQYINDTGCGDIHLAGCVVEVIGTTSAYTIRVTTPTTTSSGTVNAEFIYVNNGGSYSPGWRRQYNTKNKPTPSEIGAAASNHTHSYLPLSGGTLTSGIKFSGGGYDNHAIRMEAGDANGAFIGIGAGGLTVIGSGESTNAVRTALTNGADEVMVVASDKTIRFLTGVQDGYNSAKEVSINAAGVINAPQGMSGNASTATKLQTARTINGTSFDGSANITTANWGTARNITIGNTAKSVNGSGNVAWSLSEIGAVATTDGVANNIKLGKYATFADYDDSSILKKSYLRSGIWTTEFTDMKISGNLVYHAGRKPTASEIGAANASHTHSYLPLSGGTLTGNVIVSDAKKISLSNKEGHTNAAIGVESSTGDVYISNINNNWFRIKGDKTMTIAGSKVYTALDKPTPSEIGAAASNHTHSYLPLSGGTLTGSLKISGNNKDLVIGAGTGDVYINNTASGKYIQMKDDGLLSYSGNKIYHAGDKPTASEVGALATSGGTMSGNLTFNNAKGIYGKTAEALTDSEGATVAAGATGTLLTYNGSHNFHLGALITDKKLTVGNTYLNAAHNMYLRNVTSDGAISLQVGGSTRMTVNSTATTVSKLVSNGGITTGGSIVSDTALTDNLGSSSIPFNVGYAKQFNLVGEASKAYGYLSAYTVGTTSTNGEARLVLGNSTASGTASNASGSLFLYGTGAGYTCIRPSNNTENKYTQYFPTGNGSIPLMNKADTNYWGMVNPDGSSSSWVRTTSSGIIPFDQSATSALGTSSWPFKCAYINEIFESGTSLKNKYLTKSGGTLTGNLTVQGQTTLGATVLNNNTSLYGYNKSDTKINICGIDTSNNIYLGWNNETYINVNNTMRTYRDLHVLNGAAMRVTGQTVLARTESYRQIAVVSTAGDGNGQGDGQTHLGYFDNGYHHYFRGSGAMHVDMLGGLKIGGKRLSIGSSAHSNPATGDVWIQV